jgi:hypothetical protein
LGTYWGLWELQFHEVASDLEELADVEPGLVEPPRDVALTLLRRHRGTATELALRLRAGDTMRVLAAH